MIRRMLFPMVLVVSTVSANAAFADEADKAACVDLEEGDACTRGDGDPGTCVPDESDPDVLTCEDEAGAGGAASGEGGCSSAGQHGRAPGAALAVAVAGLLVGRRRRSR
jgi:MYXO-CTERM domain-containing protein